MNDEGVRGIYLALALLLPLSALFARRLPIGSVAKMVLAWIAIFAVLMLIVASWGRVAGVWQPVADTLGLSDQSVSGEVVRVRKAADGHFWARVTINGVERRMLIEPDATITAISAKTAQAAKLNLEESNFPIVLSTANGAISAKRSTAAALDIGGIHARDLPVIVSPALGDTDVIGMNFLSRLKSWRIEGDVLVLEPKRKGPPTKASDKSI